MVPEKEKILVQVFMVDLCSIIFLYSVFGPLSMEFKLLNPSKSSEILLANLPVCFLSRCHHHHLFDSESTLHCYKVNVGHMEIASMSSFAQVT